MNKYITQEQKEIIFSQDFCNFLEMEEVFINGYKKNKAYSHAKIYTSKDQYGNYSGIRVSYWLVIGGPGNDSILPQNEFYILEKLDEYIKLKRDEKIDKSFET